MSNFSPFASFARPPPLPLPPPNMPIPSAPTVLSHYKTNLYLLACITWASSLFSLEFSCTLFLSPPLDHVAAAFRISCAKVFFLCAILVFQIRFFESRVTISFVASVCAKWLHTISISKNDFGENYEQDQLGTSKKRDRVRKRAKSVFK